MDDIQTLIQKELDRANKKHELFHSAHEGYAVILEEFEETEEALIKAQDKLEALWQEIRADDNQTAMTMVNRLSECMEDVIAEAVQVAAMCEKYKQSLLGE